MNYFERLLEDLKTKTENAAYTRDAYNLQGRRLSQEYSIGAELGRGGYGLVKKAQNKQGTEFAVKIMEKTKIPSLPRAERGDACDDHKPLEWNILARIQHPNIIQGVDWFSNGEYEELVLELVPGSSLFDLIELNGAIEEDVARGLFIQVTSALSYLHHRGILHNDLKDENILVEDGRGTVKIIDFGSACFLANTLTRDYCGSESYSGPEVATGKPYCRLKQEIWTTGVLLYAIVCGSYPFNTILDVLVKDLQFPPDLQLSKECQELLAMILSKVDRPSLARIHSSAWLSGPVQSSRALRFQ